MPSAVVTSKGQVTVPKEVRENLDLGRGSVIDFVWEQGSYRVTRRAGSVTDIFGMLPKPTAAASLEDMDAGIAAGAAEAMRA